MISQTSYDASPATVPPTIEWRKSRYSNDQGGNCVEVAIHDGQVLVRDSKNPTGPALAFTRGEWQAFIAGAKDGEFDLA